MSTEFKLPELGENIESADVLNVLVKPGDVVELDQGVIEIETDKATIEVPSTAAGKVKEVKVKAGDKIKVGQTIFTFEEVSEKTEQKKSSNEKIETQAETISTQKQTAEKPVERKPKTQKAKSSIVEFKLPELGENIESADVLNVLVKPGDVVELDQGVIEIETDKATIEVPSTVSGIVKELLVKPGDKAKVGQTILVLSASESGETTIEETKIVSEIKVETEEPEIEKNKIPEAKPVLLEASHQPPIIKGAAPAAPSVRRIARELGVDINKVHGSGPGGRISLDDVKAYVKNLNLSRSESSFGVKQEALPDFKQFGSIDIKPMSNIRVKTAEHLSYAWAVTPHVTQFDKADITELEALRKQFNQKLQKSGVKITMTSILMKLMASALKVFPQFNSSIDMERKEIIYKKYFNIGVAVDTDHGLIVPVIKDVEKKNIKELSLELSVIAEKARLRKISLEELRGGCITITNLGGIGGTSFTPIVNSPEVAILGVSRGSFEPVFTNEKFEPRLMLPLSLSYDHRIIDGADAARFLRWLCEALEQPLKILIEG